MGCERRTERACTRGGQRVPRIRPRTRVPTAQLAGPPLAACMLSLNGSELLAALNGVERASVHVIGRILLGATSAEYVTKIVVNSNGTTRGWR